MTALIARTHFSEIFKPSGKPGFDISPRVRALVLFAASAMTLAVLVAMVRGFTGMAPAHPNIRDLAIAIHIATVLPAIPLGGYLILARKGGAWHKRLGKLWVALMVTTACAALFIKTGVSLSFIHIFVPITLYSSYKLVAAARRGDMKTHRSEILSLYLGALMIPGILSMVLPGRLLNVWLMW